MRALCVSGWSVVMMVRVAQMVMTMAAAGRRGKRPDAGQQFANKGPSPLTEQRHGDDQTEQGDAAISPRDQRRSQTQLQSGG